METIIFYAIVENKAKKICCLPEESFKILKKIGLNIVAATTIGVFEDYDKLCEVVSTPLLR